MSADARKLAEKALSRPGPAYLQRGDVPSTHDLARALLAEAARAEALEKALRDILAAEESLAPVRPTTEPPELTRRYVMSIARNALAVDLAEPDYRAELANLRAHVRHLADEIAEIPQGFLGRTEVAERVRGLVGEWPHEKTTK